MRRCLAVLAAALLSAAAPSAVHAAVTATPLTTIADETPIAAYGGWVAWSEKGADGKYRIVTFHDGRKETLSQIAPRSVPFDLDLGPGAADRPEITFSRCATEPDVRRPLPWATARSCRLRQVSLPGGGESGLAVPGRGSASDSTPSRWGSRVAFQRRARDSDVSQIMLYDLQHKRMKKLQHGAVPHSCPYRTGCKDPQYLGEVGELDLGVHDLAYSWHLSAPALYGVGVGWEARVVPTGTGRSLLAGDGYVSGACGGRMPHSPQAIPGGILFVSLQFFCENATGTVTSTTFSAGGLLSRTTDVGGGTAYAVLHDAADGTTYALLGPATVDPQSMTTPPMTLARVSGLKLTKTDRYAAEPFDTGR
jgi:hypothetical protein